MISTILQHSKPWMQNVAVGQSRRFRYVGVMSALPPIAIRSLRPGRCGVEPDLSIEA
jgi:hypothetical protein